MLTFRHITIFSVVFVLSTLLIFCRPAFSDVASVCTASERASIESSYDQMNAAFADNKMDGLMQMLTSDYTQTDPKGHVLDRSDTKKKLEGERKQIQTITCRYSITGVTPASTGGFYVDMKMHSEGTGQKKVLFMNIHGTFTNELVVRDYWVETADGWRIQSRQMFVDTSHTQAG